MYLFHWNLEAVMRNRMFLVLAGVGLCVGAGQSSAAETIGEIKRIEGAVMITQGEHFVSAQEGMKLRELDRLMALEDSSALLEFSDGCRYQMAETELLTLGSESVCVASPDAMTQAQGGGAETMAANPTAIERSATSLLEAGGVAGIGIPLAVGLGVVGGIVAVSNNFGDNSNSIPFGVGGGGGAGVGNPPPMSPE
jgi:hypothetical protein